VIPTIIKLATFIVGETPNVSVGVAKDGVSYTASVIRASDGTPLFEGTGATSDDALTALDTVVRAAVTAQAVDYETKAAALRAALAA
jgi:hypothetical protein